MSPRARILGVKGPIKIHSMVGTQYYIFQQCLSSNPDLIENRLNIIYNVAIFSLGSCSLFIVFSETLHTNLRDSSQDSGLRNLTGVGMNLSIITHYVLTKLITKVPFLYYLVRTKESHYSSSFFWRLIILLINLFITVINLLTRESKLTDAKIIIFCNAAHILIRPKKGDWKYTGFRGLIGATILSALSFRLSEHISASQSFSLEKFLIPNPSLWSLFFQVSLTFCSMSKLLWLT